MNEFNTRQNRWKLLPAGGVIKGMTRYPLLLFCLLICLPMLFRCDTNRQSLLSPLASETARYRVVFKTTWSNQTFPTNFPSNRHFSALVGATHNASATFWQPGGLAGSGIERMAELGANDSLISEIGRAIAAGAADSLLLGPDLPLTADSVEMDFSINKAFPQLTLVAMLAPSPDWFVGVHNLQLLERDWLAEKRIDLLVYDSGTDNGLRFESPNADAVPAGSIALLSSEAADTDFLDGLHRADNRVVGTFRLKRIGF